MKSIKCGKELSTMFGESSDEGNFVKTPVPLSKSPTSAQKSPSIRNMTQTVIVSLREAITHNITYGRSFLHLLVLLVPIYILNCFIGTILYINDHCE